MTVGVEGVGGLSEYLWTEEDGSGWGASGKLPHQRALCGRKLSGSRLFEFYTKKNSEHRRGLSLVKN